MTLLGLDLHFLMCMRIPFSPFGVLNWHHGHSSSFTFSVSGSLVGGEGKDGVGGGRDGQVVKREAENP